ncbi:hypothetical protein OAL86_03790 [Verrucomicrobia bacterium]|jgi:hypothetical protein|nr:hypothetical protein [Verrucomicrobiota bacterium]
MDKAHSKENTDTSMLNEKGADQRPMTLSKVDTPFLTAAFMSLLASVSLWFLVDQLAGVFVGIWVPSILSLWCGIRSRVNDSK